MICSSVNLLFLMSAILLIGGLVYFTLVRLAGGRSLRQTLALGLRGVGAAPALADALSQSELPVVQLPDFSLEASGP